MSNGRPFTGEIVASLNALDRAYTALKTLVAWDLDVEPELVFAGESTIRPWALEVDPGGRLFTIRPTVPRLFLGRDFDRLAELARSFELELELGADGILRLQSRAAS